MKDYGRKIKVSDLLRKPGQEDTIEFEKKFIENMSTITDEGISGTIIVKALDRYSVLLTLENLHTALQEVSDISGKEYIQQIDNPLYEALFIIPQEEKKRIRGKDEADEYFVINEKDESIDISEAVENAIVAVQPIVKKTPDEKMLDSWEDVESEYDQYV